MSYRICPTCSSHLFFVQTGEASKQVVTVDGSGAVQSAGPTSKDVYPPLDGEWTIRCGACSWRGTLGQLTVSDR